MRVRLIYGPFDGLEFSTGDGILPTNWKVPMVRAPLLDDVQRPVIPEMDVACYRRTFRTAPARGGAGLVVLYRFQSTERR